MTKRSRRLATIISLLIIIGAGFKGLESLQSFGWLRDYNLFPGVVVTLLLLAVALLRQDLELSEAVTSEQEAELHAFAEEQAGVGQLPRAPRQDPAARRTSREAARQERPLFGS